MQYGRESCDAIDRLATELMVDLEQGTFDPKRFARRYEEVLGPRPNFIDNLIIPVVDECTRGIRRWFGRVMRRR